MSHHNLLYYAGRFAVDVERTTALLVETSKFVSLQGHMYLVAGSLWARLLNAEADIFTFTPFLTNYYWRLHSFSFQYLQKLIYSLSRLCQSILSTNVQSPNLY